MSLIWYVYDQSGMYIMKNLLDNGPVSVGIEAKKMRSYKSILLCFYIMQNTKKREVNTAQPKWTLTNNNGDKAQTKEGIIDTWDCIGRYRQLTVPRIPMKMQTQPLSLFMGGIRSRLLEFHQQRSGIIDVQEIDTAHGNIIL